MARKMYRVNPDGSVSDYICDGRIESKARISRKDPDGVTVYFRDEGKEMRMNPEVADKYYNQTPIHTSESLGGGWVAEHIRGDPWVPNYNEAKRMGLEQHAHETYPRGGPSNEAMRLAYMGRMGRRKDQPKAGVSCTGILLVVIAAVALFGGAAAVLIMGM
jgi:hypothetical protein